MQIIEKNEKNIMYCCLSGRDCDVSGFDVAGKMEQKCEEMVQKSYKKFKERFVYQCCMIQYGKCQKFYHDIICHDRAKRDNNNDMFIASVQCNSQRWQAVQR